MPLFEEKSNSIQSFLPPIIDPAGPFCFEDPPVNLTATPPGGTWSGPGITNPGTGTFDPGVAGNGTHTISYTEISSGTSMISIQVSRLMLTAIGDGTDCNGGATGGVLLNVTGGFQFSAPVGCRYIFDWDWDGTPGNDSYPSPCSDPPGSIDMEDLNNLPAGIYSVTVTDANGCTATATAEVTQPAQDVTPSAADIQLDCYGDVGGIIDLSVTGGTPTYIYDWDWDGTPGNDDMGGPPSVTDDAEDPEILGPGAYTVTVTDFLGCTAIHTVNVTEPPELTASATSDDVDCFGGSSGEIDLTVSGGTPSFTFDWDYDGTGDNNDPEDPTGLPAGTYSVTVTDANGCTATAMVDVDEPLAAVTASATATDATCFSVDDGSIDLTPGGGTGVYTFDWDNDGTGDNDDPEDLTGLPPGSYSVTVTDANGCTAVTSVMIAEPPELTGTYTETVCAGGSTTVNGSVYDENNPTGTEVFTAANGCDSTVTVTISFDPPFTGDENYSGCTGDGYSVTIGGTVYNESNPTGTETIQNAQGCDSIVTINLVFANQVTGTETYTGCQGDGYSVIVGGTVYNEGNASGMETLTSAAGCDSIVTVSLTFNAETTFDLTNQGCQGDGFSVTVNGTVYNESNPSGTEVITNAAGCDSTININLLFGANSTGSETHSSCSDSGFSIVVNGTTYNESNPSGTEMLTNAEGCDSVVTINLTFLPPTMGEETYDGCEGDGYSVVVDGTTYDQNNPTGTETLTGSNGCDSVVTINLTFSGPVTGNETYVGCGGDGYSVIVNGTTYDESNPSGTEMLISAAGCDSIVNINLNFNANSTYDLTNDGCQGDGFEVIVNGTVYNEGNPSGQETITNAAGCDSVVTINLNFNSTSTGSETYTGCQGDNYSVIVNGTSYNESNPSGTEILTNAAGCDSTVTIQLQFNSPTQSNVTHDGCVGDGFSITINGTLYDENNPTGTEITTNSTGCDSLININLTFSPEINTNYNPTLCSGGSVVINGTLYDENNPTGTEFFIAQGGCDSVVNINLSFNPPGVGEETHDGCDGDGYFVVVNGTIYDELNPTGTETFATPTGCDTIVNIDLNYSGALFGNLDTTICSGGSIIINGTVYDEANPTGDETFTTALGCDSIVTINVSFNPPLEGNEFHSGCIGDGYFVVVNGTIYDELNPTGMEDFSTPDGCDTIVFINLVFNSAVTGDESYEGCQGDGYSVLVNGTVYDENNPTGIENIPTASGCDSVVTIDLSFHSEYFLDFTYNGCQGDGQQFVINGTVYDEGNPTGVEMMTSAAGCDSTININLSYTDIIEINLNPTLCSGGSITVGGTIYDEDNPMGTEAFVAQGGCDSVVYIDLSFNPPLEGEELYNGCIGDGYFVDVNGTIYDELNPTGTESFTNAEGCDTIVSINLQYADEIITNIDTMLCEGDFLIINGNTYDVSNPSGSETFPLAGSCDSTVIIEIVFIQPVTGQENYTGCEGDGYSVTINGTVYDESNPVGNETLVSAAGCDSIVSINLVFENCCTAETSTVNSSICEGQVIVFHGEPFSTTGTHTVTVPDAVAQGCDSVYILNLTVDDIVTGSFPDDICAGESVEFNGENYSETGVYEHTIPGGAAQGCDSVAQLVLTVHPLPSAEAGDAQQITCDQPTVTLNASSTGGPVLWAGPGITMTNQNQPNPNVSKPGMYTLTVTSPAGCQSSDQVQVDASTDLPIADAGNDQFLSCLVNEVQITAQVSGNDLEFEWTGPGINAGNAGSLTLNIDIPGMYILTLIDTITFCEAEPDTVWVTDITNEIIASVVQPEELNCETGQVTLNGSQSSGGQNIIYTWTDGQGATVSSGALASISKPGMYTLSVLDTLSGCSDEASVEVISNDAFPEIDAGPDRVLDCRTPEEVLTGTLLIQNVHVIHNWTGPPGGILSDPELLEIQVSLPGWYYLTTIDTTSGCQSLDSAYVEEDILMPEAEAGSDQWLTCHENSVVLDASQSTGGSDILHIWNGPSMVNDTTTLLEVDEAGMYYLQVVDESSGCVQIDSVLIELIEAPEGADIAVEDVECFGLSSGSIFLEGIEGGLPPFTYSIEGATISMTTDNPHFEDLPAGDYSVVVTDVNDCTWETEISIGEGIELDVEIGSNLVIELGDSVQLTSTINVPMSLIDSIVWSPASILSCTHCPNPILVGIINEIVQATVYAGSCEATDVLLLRVKEQDNVYIPNVFSPNGDGSNDYFTVFSDASVAEIVEMEIFDRWGEKVFSKTEFPTNQELLGWNGRFGEKELEAGVYVYKVKLEYLNERTEILSGDITLIR